MARAKGRPRRYPRELLADADVTWAFVRPAYRTQARFEEAVRQYQQEMDWDSSWDPGALALACPRVRVRPVFWDDLPPEEAEGLVAELTAADAGGFTVGELLFKVHNVFVRQWSACAGDYIFYEGFSLAEAPADGSPPLYDVEVGS